MTFDLRVQQGTGSNPVIKDTYLLFCGSKGQNVLFKQRQYLTYYFFDGDCV